MKSNIQMKLVYMLIPIELFSNYNSAFVFKWMHENNYEIDLIEWEADTWNENGVTFTPLGVNVSSF